jgi:hypothetical protein
MDRYELRAIARRIDATHRQQLDASIWKTRLVAVLVRSKSDHLKGNMRTSEISAHLGRNLSSARKRSASGTPGFAIDGDGSETAASNDR